MNNFELIELNINSINKMQNTDNSKKNNDIYIYNNINRVDI